MADVRWIKIYTDMISNKKIKRIRKLPEGNNIVLIWVFLLAQAGECNKSGALYLTDTLPFRSEDLAIEFDFEVTVINLALITLERFSMIEVFDEIIFIKNWEEYQNIEGMDKIREQTRLRNIKYREKQRQLQLSDVSVTSRDETELELDLELEKEIPKESSSMRGQNPFALFERHGFGKLNEITAQFIEDTINDYTEDWVKRAMTESIKHDKKVWKYVEGILKRWKATEHPEPWTLEKEEPKQSFRNNYNKQQSPRMSVVKDEGPVKEVSQEEREKMRELVRQLKEESQSERTGA